jgi:hypothetical protein
MKPVSEWTDDDLDAGGKSSGPIGRALAAEVLRLRALRLAEGRDLEEAVRVQMEQRDRAEKAEQEVADLRAVLDFDAELICDVAARAEKAEGARGRLMEALVAAGVPAHLVRMIAAGQDPDNIRTAIEEHDNV